MRTRTTTLLASIAAIAALLVASPAPAGADELSGNQPWVVVLCTFSDHPEEPRDVEYFRRLFTEDGAGQEGAYDYFDTISYGALDISGTDVVGWYELPMRRLEFDGLSRYNATVTCAEAAADDVDFAQYWGVIAVTNQQLDVHDPSSTTTLTAAADDTQTEITVASSAGFPDPPFPVFIGNGDPYSGEEVLVTDVDGTTWTVTRGYEGRPVLEHPAGAVITQPSTAQYGGSGLGRVDTPIGDEVFPLGLVILSEDANLTGTTHEMLHGFGYPHSRKLSTSTTDYCDLYDIIERGVRVLLRGRVRRAQPGQPPRRGRTGHDVDLPRPGRLAAHVTGARVRQQHVPQRDAHARRAQPPRAARLTGGAGAGDRHDRHARRR